jgi:hypothetical protein
MKREITIGVYRTRGLEPPLSRCALGLAALAIGAVAAISFTIGLLR